MHLLFHDPIPGALAHYEQETVETLSRAGFAATGAPWSRPVEGLAGTAGKVRMLGNALLNLRSARRQAGPLLQLWPSLGLPEARLWSSRTEQRYVVLHDPVPLDHQPGHSEFARRWAARANRATRPIILVHSEAALDAARRLLPHHRVELVLHPVLSEQQTFPKTPEPTVLVAGQFKTARNLDLLERLGTLLAGAGWTGRIVGRGWPELDGWQVDSRFVPEAELDELLGSAWVLLLPYRTYFQSGVAIRALENGTPTLGEATDFLHQLRGDERLLLEPGAAAEDYVAALAGLTAEPASSGFADYRDRAHASWAALLQGTTRVTS